MLVSQDGGVFFFCDQTYTIGIKETGKDCRDNGKWRSSHSTGCVCERSSAAVSPPNCCLGNRLRSCVRSLLPETSFRSEAPRPSTRIRGEGTLPPTRGYFVKPGQPFRRSNTKTNNTPDICRPHFTAKGFCRRLPLVRGPTYAALSPHLPSLAPISHVGANPGPHFPPSLSPFCVLVGRYARLLPADFVIFRNGIPWCAHPLSSELLRWRPLQCPTRRLFDIIKGGAVVVVVGGLMLLVLIVPFVPLPHAACCVYPRRCVNSR